MSSKRRLRRKACEGKARHASAEHARIAARHTKADVRDSLGVYRCRHCHHWHIGHRKGSRYIIRPTLAPLLES